MPPTSSASSGACSPSSRSATSASSPTPAASIREACRDKIFEVARELGVSGLRVGVVEGDDVYPRLGELVAAGHTLKNMDTGEPLAPVVDKVMSANAYLGARPVVEALDQGALIVLCGRVTDTALALAPMVHEFGWAEDDWDRLAAGTIAGHIIECGAQCTGGNFSRWWEVPDLWNAGYPVVEAREDGTFTVTKHAGTGGMVTVDTVSEQLLYEMGNPAEYITPDVIADFTSIRLEQEGKDRVARLRHPGQAQDAVPQDLGLLPRRLQDERADHDLRPARRRQGEARRRDRLEAAGARRRRPSREDARSEELLGTAPACPGSSRSRTIRRRWCCGWACATPTPPSVERFGKEIAPLITAGPPGVTGFAGGRPKPQEVVAYWPALLAREEVEGRDRGHRGGGVRGLVRRALRRPPADAPPRLRLQRPRGPLRLRPLGARRWRSVWVRRAAPGMACRSAGAAAVWSPRSALVLAAGFAAFAGLESKHQEILDLGFRAVLPGALSPLRDPPAHRRRAGRRARRSGAARPGPSFSREGAMR